MRQLATLDIILTALTVLVRKELKGDTAPTVTLGEVYTTLRGDSSRPSVVQVRMVLITFLPHELRQDGVRAYRLPWTDTHFKVKRT